jgi:hypothetical protein
MKYVALLLFAVSLEATAAIQGTDRTITWHPWQEWAEFRVRTGDRIRRNDPGRDAADWLWKRITSRQSFLTRSDIDAGTKTLALTLVHFSGAGLSPYKTRKSISARQRARERLAATRRKSTRHLNPSLDFFQCPGMKCTLRRAFTFAGL